MELANLYRRHKDKSIFLGFKTEVEANYTESIATGRNI
jgi:hypothetical protein